jgi:hypothetical protein
MTIPASEPRSAPLPPLCLRPPGIEPGTPAWEADIIPFDDRRVSSFKQNNSTTHKPPTPHPRRRPYHLHPAQANAQGKACTHLCKIRTSRKRPTQITAAAEQWCGGTSHTTPHHSATTIPSTHTPQKNLSILATTADAQRHNGKEGRPTAATRDGRRSIQNPRERERVDRQYAQGRGRERAKSPPHTHCSHIK